MNLDGNVDSTMRGKEEKAKGNKEKKPKKAPKEKLEVQKTAAKKKEVKKDTGLGLSVKKNDNFGDWYSEDFFDAEIKKMGIKNSYFPLFVSEKALTKEKNHIEGFAPEVLTILELYRKIYEEFLAVPVIKGMKSEVEKFAGGLYTTTVEAFIPNTGRGIQGATSHCLGQNFAKMFEINFENEKGERAMVWQNSWAYTTRTIGVMVMIHGDDKGLVLPPRVAPLQIIVVPVPYKDADMRAMLDACIETVQTLRASGFRVEEDIRDNYSPGWKYSHWELKGVPLRIEIGPKDLANKQVRVVRRDNFAKEDIPLDCLTKRVGELLEEIQNNMFERAKLQRDSCIVKAETWDEFMLALNNKKMVLAPWCDEVVRNSVSLTPFLNQE